MYANEFEVREFMADMAEMPYPNDEEMFLHDHGQCGGLSSCVICQDDRRAELYDKENPDG